MLELVWNRFSDFFSTRQRSICGKCGFSGGIVGLLVIAFSEWPADAVHWTQYAVLARIKRYQVESSYLKRSSVKGYRRLIGGTLSAKGHTPPGRTQWEEAHNAPESGSVLVQFWLGRVRQPRRQAGVMQCASVKRTGVKECWTSVSCDKTLVNWLEATLIEITTEWHTILSGEPAKSQREGNYF